MSLMRKMAKIIEKDMKMKKLAERKYPYDGKSYGNNASTIDDYVYAAAYKDEQENVWKKLYENLKELKVVIHSYFPLENKNRWADSLKSTIHNYYESQWGEGHQGPSPHSQLNTFVSQFVNVDLIERMTDAQKTSYKEGRQSLNWAIDAIRECLSEIDFKIRNINDEQQVK